MTTRDLIEQRLQALHPTFLEVMDESDQHIGHAGHQGGGHHFAVTIRAEILQQQTKVASHQMIYRLLQDLMPQPIHALRIKVL